MSYLTYLLPLAAAAFVIWCAWQWMPLFAQERLEEPEEGAEPAPRPPKPRFSFAAECGRLTRKDAFAVLVICVVYGVTAFVGLGDRTAPQSWCEFTERGRYVVVELPESTVLGSIRYYTGLHTGSYSLAISEDGEAWTELGSMEQGYADLFKWLDFPAEDMEDPPEKMEGKYLRITASDTLSLGELALYDAYGNMLDASSFTYDAGAAPLFDEQELVPEAATYLNSSYFDEIYHARTALEHIENIYPYEITHPPLGKLIIGIGIRIFGMTPFGWRFMGTLFGLLMLPILYDFIKRMSGSTKISVCGTVIFAFDFMHFVQTRIATIDTYAVFFILLMYLFMWRFVSGGRWRHLALSGLFFGLGAASKWTCIYAGGGLAVIWLVYWISRRRDEGFWRDFISNCAFCLVFFVALPAAIYYASYYCYGTAKGLEGGLGMYFTEDYAKIVWDNQIYMWEYHSDLVSTHPYSSRWYQWLVDARPILYYLEYFDDGTKSAFGAFLNPIFCWGGLFAVIGCGVLAAKDRDGRAAFIVIGYLAQFLPWVLISRLTFAYHYFPSEVFMALALCHMWRRCKDAGLYKWDRPMYAFTGLSVILFEAFYPVLTGVRTARWYTTYFNKWFPSWPF